MQHEFFADVNPVGWKSPTLGTKRIGSRVVPTSSPNSEMVTYQNALREQLQPQWSLPPIDGPVRLDWYFSRQLTAYTSASGRTVRKHRIDLTNMVKSSEDAIQPWLITNDVNVVSSWAEIVSQSADTEPSVRLVVTPLEQK